MAQRDETLSESCYSRVPFPLAVAGPGKGGSQGKMVCGLAGRVGRKSISLVGSTLCLQKDQLRRKKGGRAVASVAQLFGGVLSLSGQGRGQGSPQASSPICPVGAHLALCRAWSVSHDFWGGGGAVFEFRQFHSQDWTLVQLCSL